MAISGTRKRNLKHFTALLVIYISIIWMALRLISNYTQHGINVMVPDLTGKFPVDAAKIAAENNLRTKIIDSVFDTKSKKGIILEQNPVKQTYVKQNRMIYLTVNATHPPMIKMPNLIDVSLRQAKAIIESYGLVLGNIEYEPDFAKDAVLKQLYRNKSILHGTEIPRESRIDLVLGDGLKSKKKLLPDLIGLHPSEVMDMLRKFDLKAGSQVFDKSVEDSLKAIAYRQIPVYHEGDSINAGRGVDVFYTQDPAKLEEINKEKE